MIPPRRLGWSTIGWLSGVCLTGLLVDLGQYVLSFPEDSGLGGFGQFLIAGLLPDLLLAALALFVARVAVRVLGAGTIAYACVAGFLLALVPVVTATALLWNFGMRDPLHNLTHLRGLPLVFLTSGAAGALLDGRLTARREGRRRRLEVPNHFS